MSETLVGKEIERALKGLAAAIEAEDVEAILTSYSEDYGDAQGSDKSSRREYYNGFITNGVFKNVKIDMDALEVAQEGQVVTAGPVTYVTGAGTASFEYKFKHEADGVWRIIGGGPVQTPLSPEVKSDGAGAPERLEAMESNADRSLLGDAGRLVDRHAMVWIRQLNAPVEEVWDTVSTLEGLKKWWIIGTPSKFELKLGGAFNYHMSNTIRDFKENEYIDFTQGPDIYAGTGGMRFEFGKIDDKTSMFMFMDAFGPSGTPGSGSMANGLDAEQPGGPGTPWSGVAAGWHNLIDSLAAHINGTESVHSWEELTEFYVGYLRDLYRWNAMVGYSSDDNS